MQFDYKVSLCIYIEGELDCSEEDIREKCSRLSEYARFLYQDSTIVNIQLVYDPQ